MSKPIPALVLFLVVSASPLAARAPQQQPMTQDEVRDLIKKNKNTPDAVSKALEERKVDFDLNQTIEKKLRKAGATDAVIQAVWKASPAGRNAKSSLISAVGAQLQATDEEARAYQVLQSELDPDKKMQMVLDFEKKYPSSQLLSYVYTQAATVAQERNDLEGTINYGEKSLKLDPDNIFSLVLVALTLPQPQMQRVPPAEAAKRLSEAEEDAKKVVSLMEKLSKQPNETDEQFQKRKSGLLADAHEALGMVHLQREELDKALEEFKTAASLQVGPNPQLYYRLGEAYANVGKKTEAIEALTKASEQGQGTPMKDFADKKIQEIKK